MRRHPILTLFVACAVLACLALASYFLDSRSIRKPINEAQKAYALARAADNTAVAEAYAQYKEGRKADGMEKRLFETRMSLEKAQEDYQAALAFGSLLIKVLCMLTLFAFMALYFAWMLHAFRT